MDLVNEKERLVGGTDFEKASIQDIEAQEDRTKILNWLTDPNGFLVIVGDIGAGKTHTCSAIINEHWQDKQHNVMTDSFISSWGIQTPFSWNGEILRMLKSLSNSEHSVFDDLSCVDANSHSRDIALAITLLRHESKKPTIITTSLGKHEFRSKFGYLLTECVFSEYNTIICLPRGSRRTG